MNRVLISGGRGFIGRHCLPLLIERGFEVHAISSGDLRGDLAPVYWHRVDLLNGDQLSALVAKVQPTHLMHVAWFTEPGDYWNSLENLRWVKASLDLLQAFGHAGGKRAVIAGSCAEYDWQYGYCSEKITPRIPETFYGICKHSLQMLVEGFSRQTGLSSAWGRIFSLYGPYEYEGRLVPSIIRALLQGQPASCPSGNQVRDFLYVQDVADAFVSLLECRVQGAVNIGSGQPVVLRDLIYRIAGKLRRPDLIKLGALPKRENDPPLLVADTTRLLEEVRWMPQYDVDTGLDRTIQWWNKNLK